MLWTDAIRRAIDAPVATVGRSTGSATWRRPRAPRRGPPCPVGGAAGRRRSDSARSVHPQRIRGHRTAGRPRFVAHTGVPTGQPCRHLRLAVERAVRIGYDTDTVAAICGSLAGAWWGATAVPLEWRRVLHGRADYGTPALSAADLDRLARLADAAGSDDRIGWPSAERLVPYYDTNSRRPLAGPWTHRSLWAMSTPCSACWTRSTRWSRSVVWVASTCPRRWSTR